MLESVLHMMARRDLSTGTARVGEKDLSVEEVDLCLNVAVGGKVVQWDTSASRVDDGNLADDVVQPGWSEKNHDLFAPEWELAKLLSEKPCLAIQVSVVDGG